MNQGDIAKFEDPGRVENGNQPLLKLMLDSCLRRYDSGRLLSIERSCAENFARSAMVARNLVKEQLEKNYLEI